MNIVHELSDHEDVEHLRVCQESYEATTKNRKDMKWFLSKCTTRDLMDVRSRPTLEQIAMKLLKIQARVKRTRKLWRISPVLEARPTVFSYMYEPNGFMNGAILEVSPYYWARPKFMHHCHLCEEVSSARCGYMPLCGRCKSVRYCSIECAQSDWKLHGDDQVQKYFFRFRQGHFWEGSSKMVMR